MSSTRNKNTPGDYQLEKNRYEQFYSKTTYINSPSGMAFTQHLPGDGLLPSKMAAIELSENSSDIESFLFGIGSTNLVTPKAEVKPDIRQFKSLSIIDKTPLILPDELILLPRQRPSIQ